MWEQRTLRPNSERNVKPKSRETASPSATIPSRSPYSYPLRPAHKLHSCMKKGDPQWVALSCKPLQNIAL